MTFTVAGFWARVDKSGDCWTWRGWHDQNGYAGIQVMGERKAHRVAYRLLRGPIPEGLTLDHLCRNRGCLNPDHLEPVTIRENVLRGEGISAQCARKTTCVNGHPFAGDNLRLGVAHGRLTRICRECRRTGQRRRRLAAAT